MYAVIHTGGKQYRVARNDVIQVEKLPGAAGESIELGEVLMLGDGAEATVGAPLVDGARVTATILEQMRGPKIIVFKKKRRKNYRRKKGHRQDLTVLRITDIVTAEAPPAKAKPKAKEAGPKAAATPAKARTAAKAAKAAPAKAKTATKAAKAAPAKAKTATKAETAAPAKAGTAAKEAKAAPAADTGGKDAKPAKAKTKAAPAKTSTKAKKSAKSEDSSKAGGKGSEEKA